MNWRYILIFAVVFVPFIMMGRNPFEAPEGYVPPDEFKDSINTRLTQPEGFTLGPGGAGGAGGGTGGGMIGGGPLKGVGGFSLNNTQNNTTFTGPGLVGNVNPSFTPGTVNPYDTGKATNPLNSQQLPPPTQTDGPAQLMPRSGEPVQPAYTPPAPFQNLPTPGSKLQLPEGYPRFTDQSGKLVAFLGAEVYTTDENGTVTAMPDGTYTLSNGMELIVREGKKWWPYNANASLMKVN